ncbi:O-antigen ligase family protein [Lacinutrix iliipiscaria]|uniref:O-antigen ligase family protein n=1 Tax=Lacinutrix iliipiscaria TaxID=1230532 RepID=A0ABW5WID7_9FLAO
MTAGFITNRININKAFLLLMFCLGLALPFKDQYGTIVTVILLVCAVVIFIKQKKLTNQSSYLYLVLIPALLIIPRLIGIITGDFDIAIKELIRALPLILIPLLFILSASLNNLEKYFYYGLALGLVLFMIICECHIIYAMIKGNEPLEYFFRWRHLNINFAKPLDQHPPYIGILIMWVFIKTLFNTYLNKRISYTLLVLLSFLLFQLLARNAIIILLIVVFVYALKRKKIKQLLLVGSLGLALLMIALFHPHQYLREKIVYKLNPFDKKHKDYRITRLDASIEVFKKAPVFGVGPNNDNDLRKIEYKKMHDYTAFERNYNSHNQFFEYLVSHGIIGLLCFITLLFILIKMTTKNKDYINLLLIMCFIVSCLTESVLERTLGVKYFSILIAFILLNHIKKHKQISLK